MFKNLKEKAFIETQFPVSKISKESYKERKSNTSQTLTGLGKWWGRKPLILVRATLLGLLMPASDDAVKDREIFLKILTMDEEGLWNRKSKPIPMTVIQETLNKKELEKYFGDDAQSLTNEDKQHIQKLVFNRLSYDDKLVYCDRPEQYELIDPVVWAQINEHLDTNANNLQELIEQLGIKRFGHRPKVGDAFAGGGSIPFESARIGADVYASDLNPVATLLNWASLNIAGASDEEVEKLKAFQERVYNLVDKQITEWGIEHNESGHRADSYLYCNETICPECGYRVPLAQSWVIGKKSKTVALLKDNGVDGYDIEVVSDATKVQFTEADKMITIGKAEVCCPHCNKKTPISSVRGNKKGLDGKTIYGMRKWDKDEFIPRVDDVFQERLYAIRYVSDKGRYYSAPSKSDLDREAKVVEFLGERFVEWQEKGFIPSTKMEEGIESSKPTRMNGWQYWHQLFNPRQLLVTGLFSKLVNELAESQKEMVIGLLGVNKMTNFLSKMCMWTNAGEVENSQSIFVNQALNTLYNFGVRSVTNIENVWFIKIQNSLISKSNVVNVTDARKIDTTCDYWITDPPYADAVHYHELTEFFLAWDKALIEKAFPEWYTDSKRVLAVKGTGDDFNKSMIDVYRNLANHMPDNGYQVVMFTHQDVKIWSELSMILWSAGLRVVSAWNVATETESGGLKQGAYV
ncbi:DUF1156 domain-containing protein, partial [Candidatus Dojkabacteria bacterium]|nr:DUF1156 domain-containing protein [Candidatus Dojkabacteria bacterium]